MAADTRAMPPSGEQIELRHGSQTAVVVTVGGGVRSYRVDGRDVLDGYAEDAVCDGARGQLLVPWPNRVADGRWEWNGTGRQLALTEPEQHNAIHGLARWAEWRPVERTEDTVTLAVRIPPQPGWDWTLDVTATHRLDVTGLTVTTAITNRGAGPAPVAAGAHPYLTVGTPTVDEASLLLPGRTRILTGEQQIPTGIEPVEGTPFDFLAPRVIGGLRIDHAFADLARDAAGRATLRLQAPDGRWSELWVDEAFGWIEIFTGDALPDPARRRQGLGVEPMSAPPNGLATGEGMVVLDPGEAWRGSWGVRSSLAASWPEDAAAERS